MARIFENPDHWRQRVEEARGIATGCDDLEMTQLMLELALAYDDLAERAEERRDLQLVFCPGNSLTKSGEFLEDEVGGGGPHKGACIGVVSADEAVDFLDQIGG